MLSLDQIHLLLNTPEDEFHDFKQKWHHSKTELVRDILHHIMKIVISSLELIISL